MSVIIIHFNTFYREELADYLSVERSAMSAELSKMKNGGLVDYYKYLFAINHEGA